MRIRFIRPFVELTVSVEPRVTTSYQDKCAWPQSQVTDRLIVCPVKTLTRGDPRTDPDKDVSSGLTIQVARLEKYQPPYTIKNTERLLGDSIKSFIIAQSGRRTKCVRKRPRMHPLCVCSSRVNGVLRLNLQS